MQSFDRREPFTMQYRLRRRNGDYRWILDTGVPRFNCDGSFAGYIGSCIDITDRKLAAEALSSVSRRLIDAQEQERTRIARELHDDINQRIALLGFELDVLQQQPPESSAEVRSRLYELSVRLSEIGAEVQAISHRLHSSKLEYLGLVVACKGFCREIADRHKVIVDFRAEDIPPAISQEVSLCLFRVLQESLNNAIKHSGVEHFEVRLRGTSDAIQLTVRDYGIGLDAETAMNGQGLGLVSMRERVSLAKGTLSIASRPMEGTEITVRVPAAIKDAAEMTLGTA
jgi:signal transduction histidine kinase